MNTSTDRDQHDPLGLSRLPLLDPDMDGWPAIRAALETDRQQRRNRWRWAGGLAAAASVLLALGLSFRTGEVLVPVETVQAPAQSTVPVPETADPASTAADAGNVPELIAMSQLLESRVRGLRQSTSGLPARSALYSAELEDLIARVDGEISLDPESVDLWAQRVNLLLDLQYIYQHQFDREYGRMASL